MFEHRNHRRSVLKGLAASGALSLAGVRAGHGQAKETQDKITEAAKQEGGFLWYDHFGREEGQAVLAEFQRRVPFLKKLEYVEVPAAQKQARFIQECLAGGPTSDIMITSAAALQQLADRKFLHDVDWESIGIVKSAVATPNSQMTFIASPIQVAVYNTNRVSAADVPKTWEDLVDPKWKGRTGAWARPVAYISMLPAWGEQGTRDYVKKLVALEPRLYPGTYPLAQAIGAGEVDVGIGTVDGTTRILQKGAPVKFVALDPTPLSLTYGAVVKFGKNPNVAKLFLSWLNTTEGALVFERITERGNHLVAGTKSAVLVKGLKLSFISADEEVSRSAQLNAMELEFARALQRRGA
jgi:iron(III) transport system substrate-binding protein